MGDICKTKRDMSTRVPNQPVKLKVGFLLAPNFTLLAFAGFVDALRLAADEGDRSRQIACAWEVMTSDGSPAIASCGVAVAPTAGLVAPDRFDYVVVVGGLRRQGPALPEPGLRYLRQAAAARVSLVGVCTGSFILAEAGLMVGRSACVSWFHHAEFGETYPNIPAHSDRLFIIDGPRITSAGGVSVILLASHLIELALGEGRARSARRIMIESPEQDEKGLQPVAFPRLAQSVPQTVRRALLTIEQKMSGPISLGELAAFSGVGKRQLCRQFFDHLGQTPMSVLRELRLDHARRLLRTTNLSVTEVGFACGFSQPSHFARAYRRRWSRAPSLESRDIDSARVVNDQVFGSVEVAGHSNTTS